MQPARAVVRYDDTRRPGLYKLEAADGTTRWFAVNAARTESDLTTLTDEQMTQLATQLGADVVTSYGQYAELDATRRYGTEIWQPLLIALLAFMFGELLLQQWMGKRRLA
jgi:hypothetical protein